MCFFQRALREATPYLLQIMMQLPKQKISLGVGLPRDILRQASDFWEFEYVEIWRKTQRKDGEGCILTLDEDAMAMHPKATAQCVTRFREASREYTFERGQGIPGRVWDDQKIELQTNVQALPESVFLRRKHAGPAGMAGAIGKPPTATRSPTRSLRPGTAFGSSDRRR